MVILTIKTIAELRNVGDAAYAMSHAAAEACTVLTVAGCRAWHWWVSGYGYSAATYTTAEHWMDLLCVVRV